MERLREESPLKRFLTFYSENDSVMSDGTSSLAGDSSDHSGEYYGSLCPPPLASQYSDYMTVERSDTSGTDCTSEMSCDRNLCPDMFNNGERLTAEMNLETQRTVYESYEL